jgi:hypothetical protein
MHSNEQNTGISQDEQSDKARHKQTEDDRCKPIKPSIGGNSAPKRSRIT